MLKPRRIGQIAGRIFALLVASLGGSALGLQSDDDNWDPAIGIPGGDGPVRALMTRGDKVYVAGRFSQIGGVAANSIAAFESNGWTALGAGISGGFLPTVFALANYDGQIYAGGAFSQAGALPVSNLASWDGTNWSSCGNGISGPGTPIVRAMAVAGGRLIIGGTFSTAGGFNSPNIAAWDGTNWMQLGSGIPGTAVDSLAAIGSTIYAGGRFRLGGGITATNVAMWNGTSWLALGAGIRDWDQAGGGGGLVRSLLADGNSLIAAGSFRLAGGSSAINIAKWDGNTWQPLGSGIDASGEVYALAFNGTDLYAGGYFGSAGSAGANDIAKWDGMEWSPLASGIGDRFFSATVLSLAARGSELLVAGGDITSAGGKPASNMALWHIPHSLNIKRLANEVVLSWPATGTNFVLEATWDLGEANWQGVSGAPSIVNDQCVVTLAPGPGHQFFRLRRR